jgi:hypothetical protein
MYTSALSRAVCGLAMMAWLSGCASMSAQKITLDGNGKVTQLKKVRGLPITVQQPKYAVFLVEETVTETFRLVAQPVAVISDGEGDGPNSQPEGTLATTNYIRGESKGKRTDRKLLNENPILMGETQMFALDLKRPAAGTIDYSVELQNQYPSKITGNLEDKTIDSVSAAISKLVDDALKITGKPDLEKQGAEMTEDVLVSSQVVFIVMSLSNPTNYKIIDTNLQSAKVTTADAHAGATNNP